MRRNFFSVEKIYEEGKGGIYLRRDFFGKEEKRRGKYLEKEFFLEETKNGE